MNTTRHDPHTDTAAAHRRRHDQSHAEAELYDNPAARQHPGEPVPVPEQAVTDAVEAMGQAWTVGSGHAALSLPRREQFARAALEAAAPAIREQAAAAERDRIRQLAVEHGAQYPALCEVPGIGGQEWGFRPFADLLGGGS